MDRNNFFFTDKKYRPRSRRSVAAGGGVSVAFLIATLSTSSLAAKTDPSFNLPAYVEADEMNYDSTNGIVTASGNVEITQGQRVVLANMLTYNERINLVTASGQVSLLEPDGKVFFGEVVELKDDLKRGVVRDFRARMTDGSLIAANSATRVSDKVTKLDKAVYSPCKVCEGRSPLWQLRAGKVTIDEEKQKMYYRDAFFDAFGVPIMYTPYFSHPTPNAERQSGFLTPVFKTSGTFGATLHAPYYYNIAPNMDATITPVLTSKEGPIMEGQYRMLSRRGNMQLEGSITNPDRRDETGAVISGNELRWHVEGNGNFALSDYWSMGFDGKRASDDTYLGKYHYGYEDYLTARGFVNGVAPHQYFTMQGITFQGLRETDNPATTPLVMPELKYSYVSDPVWGNLRWFTENTAFSLSRDEGAKSNRGSTKVGIKLPSVTSSGIVYEVAGSVRGDVYQMDDHTYQTAAGINTTSDSAARAIPEISAKVSYPFIGSSGHGTMIIEPIATIHVGPDSYNQNKTPNEDSQIVEFTDTNLFEGNRFTGIDRFETGVRVSYGIRGAYDSGRRFMIDYLLGQSIVDEENPIAQYLSSDSGTNSDYIGMIRANVPGFSAGYRFRLDEDDFSLKRSELTTFAYINPVGLSVDYDYFHKDPFVGEREQVTASTSVALSENWSLNIAGQRDLSDDGGPIANGANIVYKDECIAVTTGVRREYIRDRDIKPNTSVQMQVSLKNLD